MLTFDVVVIGGSAAGIPAAITSRRHCPDKSVLLLRKEEQTVIPSPAYQLVNAAEMAIAESVRSSLR